MKLRKTLDEVFDSQIKLNWEYQTKKLWSATFSINETKYLLKIEKDITEIDSYEIYAIKFFWWDGRHWNTRLTHEGRAFTVFGALRKATIEFFEKIKPAVFLFVGDQYRDGAYRRLLYELARVKGNDYGFLDDLDLKKYVYVLLRKDIPNETIDKIKTKILAFSN